MLRNLLAETTVLQSEGNLDIEITGISTDSRAIASGNLFVACRGQKSDGRSFTTQAIANGAVAIVCEPPFNLELSVPRVYVPDARRALAEIAAAFYGHPSRTLGLIGVTGTDGKTSTTHMSAAILRSAGLKVGHVSTVAMDWGDGADPNRTANTTPDSRIIQSSLARMRDAGVQVVVLEVSSHALVTHRVHRCAFDCAIFTNLAPEHLDFHGTLDNYREAKARLFAMLDANNGKAWPKLGVVHGDDPSAFAMRGACTVRCRDFGFGAANAVSAEVLRDDLTGTTFQVRSEEGQAIIRSRVPGRYNVLNWLGAYTAARNFGATLDDLRRTANEFVGVPGRLEPLRYGQPFDVFVDFAHTPQGLATALDTLRASSHGKLIALFGQAGGRDTGNRTRMAEAVAGRADYTVLTTDDPYDEDPQSILDDLATAMRTLGRVEGRDFWAILDRRDAIAHAIGLASPGDCVLLAGRGPEEIQVIGNRRIALNDSEVARSCIAGRTAA